MTFRRDGLLSVAGVALLAGCSAAPVEKTHELPGSIVADLAPLPDEPGRIDVELRDAAGTLVATRPVDACHEAVFDNVPDGTYSLKTKYAGKETAVANIPVSRGNASLVDVKLERAEPPKPGPHDEVCRPPQVRSGQPPVSDKALRKQLVGCVVARCRVTVEGDLRNCHIVQSLPGATEETLASLERRRYTPFLCKGVPIEADYIFRIRYR